MDRTRAGATKAVLPRRGALLGSSLGAAGLGRGAKPRLSSPRGRAHAPGTEPVVVLASSFSFPSFNICHDLKMSFSSYLGTTSFLMQLGLRVEDTNVTEKPESCWNFAPLETSNLKWKDIHALSCPQSFRNQFFSVVVVGKKEGKDYVSSNELG